MAQRGEDMPNDLSSSDRIIYLELRSLYGQVRNKIIGRDVAVKEKKQLVEDHRCYVFQEQMRQQWVQVIKDTELARAEFRKDPSIENGYKLVNTIEGKCLRELS